MDWAYPRKPSPSKLRSARTRKCYILRLLIGLRRFGRCASPLGVARAGIGCFTRRIAACRDQLSP
jgi:hypothetical protein